MTPTQAETLTETPKQTALPRPTIQPSALIRAFGCSLLCLLAASSVAGQRLEGPTLEGRVFDVSYELQVAPEVDGEVASIALFAAADELAQLHDLLHTEIDADPLPEGSIAKLNSLRGESMTLDSRAFELLARAREYCQWSAQAHGPLGGNLYGLWGLHRSVGGPPTPSMLSQQLPRVRCELLTLDAKTLRARVEPGSRVELWGFAHGYAVDRAVAVLHEQGVDNAWVQIGFVTRGVGGGPYGNGWPMSMDPTPDERVATERIVLRDQAVAMASRRARSMLVGGLTYPPYVDQRSGRPIADKIAVLAVSRLAVDADALSVALFLMSNREGEFRLGSLEPKPAVRWYLGGETGAPLILDTGWAALEKWRPKATIFDR